MPNARRQYLEPTDEWARVAARAAWPEQRAYEELRPMVLLDRPVETRARETAHPRP